MNAPVIDKIDKSTESFRDKILRKCGESVEMKEKFFEKYAEDIEELSREMAKRFVDGKKLLTMGNGGSLADAQFGDVAEAINTAAALTGRGFDRH